MRKPGQIPLVRPAPVETVPQIEYFESELGTLIGEDDPILWVRLAEEPSDLVVEQHFVGQGTVNSAPSRNGMGEGFGFDGTDDSVYFGCDELTNVPPRLLQEADGFTVELLFSSEYVASSGATKLLRWGSYGIELQAYKFAGSDNSGYLTFRFYDEAAATHTVEIYDASIYTPGIQHHVAVTYDGSDLRLYVDGVERQVEPETAIPYWGFSATASDGLGIATDGPFGGQFFEGEIAEVAIYDTVLSEARIIEHHNAGRDATLFAEATVSPWGTPEGLAGAASFYLSWLSPSYDIVHIPSDRDVFKKASAKITIPGTPSVTDLYYWALQVSFYNDAEELVAAAHTGLQWISTHPNSKAVNWGGYLESDSSILEGTESALPSTTDNDNTRDFDWQTDTEYTFEIFHVGGDFWRATVNDVVIRDLEVPGATYIADPLFFSEVFADCYAPTHSVLWRDPYLYDEADVGYYFPRAFRSYQVVDGCPNSESEVDGLYFRMTSNTTREGAAVIDLQGDIVDSGFYLEEWPSDSGYTEDISWSLNITDFPYGSVGPTYIESRFLFTEEDDEFTQVPGSLKIRFNWDEDLEAFDTVSISGNINVFGPSNNIDLIGTAHVDSFTDGGEVHLDLKWQLETTYDLRVYLDVDTFKILVDDVLVFSFPNIDLAYGLLFEEVKCRFKSPCGGEKVKFALGNVTAEVGGVTETMTSLWAEYDPDACDDENFYVNEDDFWVFENQTPRVHEDGYLSLP